MDCSPDVFESSGIEIIGDVLPDLSPIKANSRGRKFPDGTLCRMHCMSLKLAKKIMGSGYHNKRSASFTFESLTTFFPRK